ncbi:MAG TPA: urease accessory protein UreD [Xanthobacteraceae bacterium]|nr:urease accessory protein UreD [Xanthobacteraceae bacterium]
MDNAAVLQQPDIFAANRARGSIAVGAEAVAGVTRRAMVREEGSLRVRFPGPLASDLQAVIVNTAGGAAGGDRYDIACHAGVGADLTVSTAAAEKIYRSIGADAEVSITLNVEAGGALAWLPQETIFFDDARLSRRIDVTLAEGASVLMTEAVVFGRSAMGEAVHSGSFIDRWRVLRGGKLIFAETVRLDGKIAARLAEPAAAGGNIALATVLIAPGGDAQVEAIRAKDDRFRGEVGASAWNGFVLVRLCAPDGAMLRHDLVAVLSAVGRTTLPRLWSM